MKYSQARQGRVFVVRLYQGEILHEEIERLALSENIRAAYCIAVGGADAGSRLVIGPRDGTAQPVDPMEACLTNVHEVAGVGTIFPGPDGNPMLHMHAACGRQESTITGCVRAGVKVWKVLEVIIQELVDTTATRKRDNDLGFALLDPS